MAAAFISGRFVRLLRPPGSGGKRPTHPQRRINAPISSFICSPTRVWILKGRSSGFGSAWQLVEPAFWSIKNCRIYGRLHQRNAPICHFCQSRSPRLSAQGRETGPCCASYANLSFMFWGFLFSRTHTHTHKGQEMELLKLSVGLDSLLPITKSRHRGDRPGILLIADSQTSGVAFGRPFLLP